MNWAGVMYKLIPTWMLEYVSFSLCVSISTHVISWNTKVSFSLIHELHNQGWQRTIPNSVHHSTECTRPVKAKHYGRTQRGPNRPPFQVSLAVLFSYLLLPYMAWKWRVSKAFDTLLEGKKYLNLQNVVCQVWGKKSDPKANNVISPDCGSSPGEGQSLTTITLTLSVWHINNCSL